jgi:hypothetical protein
LPIDGAAVLPSGKASTPAKVADLSPFKVRIAALSEFLLNVKLPPVPDVFPNNTVASEFEDAEVNLKYFVVGRLMLPAKVVVNPDKVKAVATELPVENTKSVEFECDILDTSVPECLNIIASVFPEAPSSSNTAFPVVSIVIPLALVVVIEPAKVAAPALSKVKGVTAVPLEFSVLNIISPPWTWLIKYKSPVLFKTYPLVPA